MRDKMPRTAGVTLRLLTLADVTGPAYEKWKAHAEVDGKTVTATRLKVGNTPYAAVEHNGRLYVICVEGVGWEVTDTAPLEVDLYSETLNDKDQIASFGMFPVMEAHLTPAEVRERMTDETVDLSDLIRSFGQRLEDNFWAWHRLLTKEAKTNA
jgi:hypothetical protein